MIKSTPSKFFVLKVRFFYDTLCGTFRVVGRKMLRCRKIFQYLSTTNFSYLATSGNHFFFLFTSLCNSLTSWSLYRFRRHDMTWDGSHHTRVFIKRNNLFKLKICVTFWLSSDSSATSILKMETPTMELPCSFASIFWIFNSCAFSLDSNCSFDVFSDCLRLINNRWFCITWCALNNSLRNNLAD